MATLKVTIQSIERRLRGGAQSFLVRDSAGVAYVAKFVGNPQGTRTLVNEWMVSRLLKHLRLSTPEVCRLHLPRGIAGEELLEFQVGKRKVPIAEGLHFGSRCPANPDRKAIFDFLPRRLLDRVVNLPDLLMAYAFDKWVGQSDNRQAIFIRERVTGEKPLFRTYLIDQGLSFGGSRWVMSDVPLAGLFHDRSIYLDANFAVLSRLSVERIQQLPEETLFSIVQEIPHEWLAPGDQQELVRLVEMLAKRRVTLNDTIDRMLRELHQAGISIPKTAKHHQMLALLLIASFMPVRKGMSSATARYGSVPSPVAACILFLDRKTRKPKQASEAQYSLPFGDAHRDMELAA